MDGDKLLHRLALFAGFRAGQQMFLGDGKHPARPAGGIVEGKMLRRPRDVEQLDHEADHLARREVLPGLLAALFGKAPQKALVDVSHLQRREVVRPQRHRLVLVDDRGQAFIARH